MHILLVAGARPNFMKIAPIYLESLKHPAVECTIVHTGQHYDYAMSQSFFDDLELPAPDHFLEAGSGSHAEQTARIMVAFERVCIERRPDWVVVVGDVNSTLACAIVAKKLCIQVAHVEAGLRSFDRTMPEEINRRVTDAVSDAFFVTEQSGVDNLLREGAPTHQVHLVGHVMIDNLLRQLRRLESGEAPSQAVADARPPKGGYVFLTLHRPSNVDRRDSFQAIMDAVNTIAEELPVVFLVHPRTRARLDQFGLSLSPNIRLLPPLGFRESLFLWKDARLVMTDSGGLQEETSALGIPCLTLRENTERPVTIDLGSNMLAGTTTASILSAYARATKGGPRSFSIPPLWDGRAAERIWTILCGE